MNIAIIGAGFTGLSAGYKLQKKGHQVTIFEKEAEPGGLAIGFKKKNWDFSLEKHYHHIFESDKDILKLAQEVDFQFEFKNQNTSSFLEGGDIMRLTPLSLMTFSKISIFERLRMGFALFYLKYLSKWQNLENEKTHDWCIKTMGEKPYKMFWEPLMISKFGPYYKDISLAWFWARIKARTDKLGYPQGGFQKFADVLAKKIEKNGGEIFYNQSVEKIYESKNGGLDIKIGSKTKSFDKVLVTVPNFFFEKMVPSLPVSYKKKLLNFKGIGALNMVLELEKPFFKGEPIYWLSICDKDFPFLAVVEHTNFIDKKHYDNKYLLYVGNYLPQNHKYFKMTKEGLLKIYDPYLSKFNPNYRKNIKSIELFPVAFAQPIVTRNFSKKILPFETPIKNLYLANMQQVYPWDRGTNFAVKMGVDIASQI